MHLSRFAPALIAIAACALFFALSGENTALIPTLGIVVTAGISPKKLLEQRGQILNQTKEIIEAAHKEGRDLTEEENARLDEMFEDADTIKTAVDEQHARAQAHARRTEQQQAAEEYDRDTGNRPRGSAAGSEPRDPGVPTPEDHSLAVQGWFINQSSRSDVPLRDEHREAANRVGLRLNARELVLNLEQDYPRVRHDVRNALQTTGGSSGGYLRPQGFQQSLETAMLHFGGILNVAEVIRTPNANPFPWPTANDTTNTGRQIGEAKPISNVDPSFAQVQFFAYKFTSEGVLISFELLRDTPFRLEAVIGSMLGERLGRILNTKCTIGTGAATPTGIVPGAVVGKTTTSATAIAAAELLDLTHSVDKAYRDMPGVGWMFHDSIALALRKLVDGNGRFHWSDGMQAGEPNQLFTKPVQINNDMASSIAAGNDTALFGHFPHYKIRQVNTVRIYRLTERHRENDQDEFLAFTEFDGKLLNAGGNPVKKLRQTT